jgi:hypothetical protein
METLSGWTDEMLSLESGTLNRLARLGAKIKTLLGGKSRSASLQETTRPG